MKLKSGGVDITSAVLAQMRSLAVQAFEALEKGWALHDVVLVDFKVCFCWVIYFQILLFIFLINLYFRSSLVSLKES